MKHLNLNFKNSILSNVSRSRWAGYKFKLSELSISPSVDEDSINMSMWMFNIHLLEDLVEIYNDYFIDKLDYEFFMEEHSNFGFDFFIDNMEDVSDMEDLNFFFNNSHNDDYVLPIEFVDFLLFEDIEEDFISQFNYNFLIWGPLEFLYHSMTVNTWTQRKLPIFHNLSVFLFLKFFHLFGYFINLYTLQGYAMSKNFLYSILNKWNFSLLYYRSKSLRILYSNWFEVLPKSTVYYLVYFLYFFFYVIISLFLYNLALLFNIFKIISYWITNKIFSCMFYLNFSSYIYIIIL